VTNNRIEAIYAIESSKAKKMTNSNCAIEILTSKNLTEKIMKLLTKSTME
jgi:hypothetical protein